MSEISATDHPRPAQAVFEEEPKDTLTTELLQHTGTGTDLRMIVIAFYSTPPELDCTCISGTHVNLLKSQFRVSTANLPKDSEDSKLSPRFIGPFKIIGRPGPNTYKVGFGDNFPGLSAHINVSDFRPYAQPCATTLRSGQDDEPLIGADDRKPIEALTAQSRARGRPSRQTGPALQYKVKFKGLDCHHSV
jgi:hypothetical protein